MPSPIGRGGQQDAGVTGVHDAWHASVQDTLSVLKLLVQLGSVAPWAYETKKFVGLAGDRVGNVVAVDGEGVSTWSGVALPGDKPDVHMVEGH